MRFLFLAALFLLILITLSSCENTDWRHYEETMSIADFPIDIGTQFAYEVYDSLNTTFDTLIISIEDSVSFTDSGYFYLWQYDYGDTAETMYVNIVDDTLTFYRMDSLNFALDFKIVFPLKLGKKWNIGADGWITDSCEITHLEPFDYGAIFNSVNTPPAIPQSFVIERQQYGLNETGSESYWVHPGIGIVKKSDKERLWVNSKDEVWNLISINRNDSISFEQFPLPLGGQWVYQWDNPYNSGSEDYIITIFDSTATLIEEYYLTYNHHFNEIDYERQATINPIDQTMKIRWGEYLFLNLDFPLYVGKKYANPDGYDTTRVLYKTLVETPLGNFENAFVLQSRATGFEVLIDFTYWVVPNYGVVRLNIATTDLISNNTNHETLLLKSFMVLKPASVFNLNKFEFATGSYWKYLVHDNLIDCIPEADCVDTMTVTLMGGKFVNDDYVKIWQYEYLEQTDTEYTYVNQDTLFFARYTDPLFPYRAYKFPITVGDGWVALTYNDSSTVIGLEDITTETYSFKNCSQIETSIWCGDECGHVENDWLVPNVGVVKKSIYESEYDIMTGSLNVNIDQYWELVDYYLESIPIDCTLTSSMFENLQK